MPEIQVVTSAAGFTVHAGPYESREQAERMASLIRSTIIEDRTEADSRVTRLRVLPNDLNEGAWDY